MRKREFGGAKVGHCTCCNILAFALNEMGRYLFIFIRITLVPIFFFKLNLFFKFIYSYVHTLFGPFLSPAPCLSPPPPSLPGRTCSSLLKSRHKQ
jgi:hypothetical protein